MARMVQAGATLRVTEQLDSLDPPALRVITLSSFRRAGSTLVLCTCKASSCGPCATGNLGGRATSAHLRVFGSRAALPSAIPFLRLQGIKLCAADHARQAISADGTRPTLAQRLTIGGLAGAIAQVRPPCSSCADAVPHLHGRDDGCLWVAASVAAH